MTVNKTEARQIARFRGGLIIQSALDAGWEPDESGDLGYSQVDSQLIVEALQELANRLHGGE